MEILNKINRVRIRTLTILLMIIFLLTFLTRCKKESVNKWEDSNVFQDSYGRTIILHGASLYTNDDPNGYHRYNTNSAKRLINSWGLNSVRMFWSWHAIEPDSGQFDAAKLDSIVKVVETFTNEGVYVVLAVNGTGTSGQEMLGRSFSTPEPVSAEKNEAND